MSLGNLYDNPDNFRLITKIRLDHPLNFTLKAKRDVFAIAKLQKRVRKNRGDDCSIQL